MPDFFTDAQLNEGYHTKSEYVQANDKYGYIYKYQKFENADTVEKLLEYAADWVKNNYHGGLTSFDITAFDMHLFGENPAINPYMTGDKIDVYYPDPDTETEVCKMLTCISTEYDLYNPDKNKYKIGIPDSALNKVYGETVKSGGGGGGGKNTEDENDEEDSKEGETFIDRLGQIKTFLEERGWINMSKFLPGGEDGTVTTDPNLQTPKSKDPTNPFQFNLTADNVMSQVVKGALGEYNKVKTSFIENTNKIKTDGLSAVTDVLVGGKTTTTDLETTQNAEIGGTTSTTDLDVSGTADIANFKLNGNTVNIYTSGGELKIKFNGRVYNILTE